MHLRFDPQRAHLDTDEHPSDATRAYVLFRCLETPEAGYGKLATLLRTTWRQALAGVGTERPDGDTAWLDRLADAIWAMLTAHVPAARYTASGWQQATALGRRLHLPAWRDGAGALSTRDVLNGAWLCRLDYGERHVPTLSRRAFDLCRELVSHRAAPA